MDHKRPNAPTYYWSSLQIDYNMDLRKRINSDSLGFSYIMALGEFTGGEVVIPYLGVSSSLKGCAICFDGTMPHWSGAFEGDRFSIVVFCHDQNSRLSTEDREYLTELGFSTPADACSVGSRPKAR